MSSLIEYKREVDRFGHVIIPSSETGFVTHALEQAKTLALDSLTTSGSYSEIGLKYYLPLRYDDSDLHPVISQLYNIEERLLSNVTTARRTLHLLEQGGKFPRHWDPNTYSTVLLIRKPEEGGDFYVEDKLVSFEEGDLLVLRQGIEHEVLRVKRGQRISLVSFLD